MTKTARPRSFPRCRPIAVALCAMFLGMSSVWADEEKSSKGVSDHTSDYMRDYLSDPRRTGSLAGSIIGAALTAHPAGPVIGSLIGFFVGKRSMFHVEPDSALAPQQAGVMRDIIPPAGSRTAATLSLSDPSGISFTEPAPGTARPFAVQDPTALAPPPIVPDQPAPLSPLRFETLPPRDASPLPPMAAPAPTPLPIPTTAPTPATAGPVPAPPVRESAPQETRPQPAPAPVYVPVAPPPLPPGFSRAQIAALCSGRAEMPADPRLRAMCFYYRAN